MSTAEELIVALKSEGANETRDDIEGVAESTEQVNDSLENTADNASDFQAEFSGAISAAVAGMAIGIGGLTSQIPILGELFAGLGAIMSAFGFQIDRLARNLGAGGLTGRLFEVSEAIFSLEGPAATAAGVVGGLGAAIAGAAAGLVAWLVASKGFVGAATAIGAALKTAALAVAGFIGGLSAATVGLALAVAAVVAFAAAYITNFKGVRDTTNSVLSDIYNAFLGLVDNFVEWAGMLADKAFNWGKDIVYSMVAGIKSALSRLRGVLNDIGGTIESTIGIDVSDFTGGGGGGGGGGRPSGGLFGGGGGGISLDGRQLSESTGRYRADPSRRRGI